MHYHPLGSGRFIMRLDPGDEIMATLRQFAVEEEVAGAYVTGLGAASHATRFGTTTVILRRFTMPVGHPCGGTSIE